MKKFRKTRKMRGAKGSKSRSKSRSKSKESSKPVKTILSREELLNFKDFVESKKSESGATGIGLSYPDTFSLLNELLPYLGEDYAYAYDKKTAKLENERIYQMLNTMTLWCGLLNKSKVPFEQGFPFINSEENPQVVATMKQTIESDPGDNIVKIKARIIITLHEIYLFKHHIAEYMRTGNACDELLDYIPQYAVVNGSFNKKEENALCCVILVIGFLGRILHDANICDLLLKGGKAMQFYKDVPSNDIDILIVPTHSPSSSSSHTDSEFRQIGEQVTTFLLWVMETGNSESHGIVLSKLEKGAPQSIFKISFDRGIATASTHSKPSIFDFVAPKSKQLKITGKDGYTHELTERAQIEKSQSVALTKGQPRELTRGQLVDSHEYAAILDMGYGYNSMPNYVKYIFQSYNMQKPRIGFRSSPYQYFYPMVGTIIKEKIYYLIDYMKYYGQQDANAKMNNYFRDKTYAAVSGLTKSLDLFTKSNKSYLKTCISEIIQDFHHANSGGFVIQTEIINRFIMIQENITSLKTDKKVLDAITHGIYADK